MTRFLIGLAMFAAVTMTAVAAAPDEPREGTEPFSEAIEVRIANFDVSVTDADGSPVRGLTREDFVILEEGKLQEITNFYAVGPAPSNAPSESEPKGLMSTSPSGRRRVVIFFIDVYSLDPFRRNEAIRAMQSMVSTSLGTGDLVMLAVFDRSLRIPVMFTTDIATMESELAKLAKVSGGGLARDRSFFQERVRNVIQYALRQRPPDIPSAYRDALSIAAAWSDEQQKRRANLAGALEKIFRSAAGTNGRKVVVFAGESFPRFVGLEAYQSVNELFEPYRFQISMRLPQSLALRSSLAQVQKQVTEAALSNEITFHTLYSGQSGGASPAEALESSGDTAVSSFLEMTNNAGSLQAISKASGGIALIGSSNFQAATDQIASDLSVYYSLGYRIPARPDGGTYRVSVRTKNPRHTVRTRNQLITKSAREDLHDRVTSALFGNSIQPETTMSVEVRRSEGSRRRSTFQLHVTFPSTLVTLLPSTNGQVSGGIDLLIAVGNKDHDLSEVQTISQALSFPAGEVPPRISFQFPLVVRNGSTTASVAVVDQLTRETIHRVVPLPN